MIEDTINNKKKGGQVGNAVPTLGDMRVTAYLMDVLNFNWIIIGIKSKKDSDRRSMSANVTKYIVWYIYMVTLGLPPKFR